MLTERFLDRLRAEFPEFYARVDAEAREDAARYRIMSQGDTGLALAHARLAGAGRLWWPYMKGSVPLVRRERDAMEAFSRLVLTVDHVIGYDPGSADAARDHVLEVLRSSLDIERLRALVTRKEPEVAAAGLAATVGAMMAPINLLRTARTWSRWLPGWGKIAAGAVVAAVIATVPLVAGMSAGHHAERAARNDSKSSF